MIPKEFLWIETRLYEFVKRKYYIVVPLTLKKINLD